MAASQLLHTPGSEHLSPLTRAPQHLSVAASQIRIILELANIVPLTCRTRTKYWLLLQRNLLDPARQSPILSDTRSGFDTLGQVRSAVKKVTASQTCRKRTMYRLLGCCTQQNLTLPADLRFLAIPASGSICRARLEALEVNS